MLLLVLTVGPMTDKRLVPPQPRMLASSSERKVQVPVFAYIENQCDQDGNLYFHLDKGNYNTSDTLVLSSDGKEGKVLTLSGEFSDPALYAFANFSVTPDGDLYILTAHAARHYLFGFGSDGSMKSPVTLMVPDKVMNDKIVVFEDGGSLFYGFYTSEASSKLAGKSYVALLDASGQVRKELNASVNETLTDVNKIGDLHDGGIAIGEDGNVYILTSKEIVVLSQSGDVVRRLTFEKPDPKSLALNLYMSGGLAVVGLSKIEAEREVRKDFLVLDASTGKPMGLYEPSADIGFSDVCFSRNEGFTFMRMEKGQRTLLIAPLR